MSSRIMCDNLRSPHSGTKPHPGHGFSEYPNVQIGVNRGAGLIGEDPFIVLDVSPYIRDSFGRISHANVIGAKLSMRDAVSLARAILDEVPVEDMFCDECS